MPQSPSPFQQTNTQPEKIHASSHWQHYPDLLRWAEEINTTVKMLQRFNLHDEVLDALLVATEDALYYGNVPALVDRYNEAFSEKGWVGTECFSADVMLRALQVNEEQGFEAAEEVILDWFQYWTIHQFAIGRCGYFGNLKPRTQQLKEALELTCEERYSAAVHLILAVCEGFAADVLGISPLFNRKANLTFPDSFVGHNSSLPKLIRLFTEQVPATSEEPADMPLRHGIVHGRILDYDHENVCMKAWLLFIALTDLHIEKRNREGLEAGHLTQDTFHCDNVVHYLMHRGRTEALLNPDRRTSRYDHELASRASDSRWPYSTEDNA